MNKQLKFFLLLSLFFPTVITTDLFSAGRHGRTRSNSVISPDDFFGNSGFSGSSSGSESSDSTHLAPHKTLGDKLAESISTERAFVENVLILQPTEPPRKTPDRRPIKATSPLFTLYLASIKKFLEENESSFTGENKESLKDNIAAGIALVHLNKALSRHEEIPDYYREQKESILGYFRETYLGRSLLPTRSESDFIKIQETLVAQLTIAMDEGKKEAWCDKFVPKIWDLIIALKSTLLSR